MSICDVSCICPGCGWTGTVEECESNDDEDSDGELCCPKCLTFVVVKAE